MHCTGTTFTSGGDEIFDTSASVFKSLHTIACREDVGGSAEPKNIIEVLFCNACLY